MTEVISLYVSDVLNEVPNFTLVIGLQSTWMLEAATSPKKIAQKLYEISSDPHILEV
jgi:hypothetical protein